MNSPIDLINKPLNQIPCFDIIWDFDPASFFYSSGHLDRNLFTNHYKSPFVIGHIKISELDKGAYGNIGVPTVSLWESGYADKTAGIIWHCLNGGKISPPIIGIHPIYRYRTNIDGGYHRIELFRRKYGSDESIPIIVSAQEYLEIGQIMPAAIWNSY